MDIHDQENDVALPHIAYNVLTGEPHVVELDEHFLGPNVPCPGPLPYSWYRQIAHLLVNYRPDDALVLLRGEQGIADLNQMIQAEEALLDSDTATNRAYSGDWALLGCDVTTLLHIACLIDSTAVVGYLLSRDDIDVNFRPLECGPTALCDACNNLSLGVVRLLLRDPRVDVLLTSPFQDILDHEAGNLSLMEMAIASGRVPPQELNSRASSYHMPAVTHIDYLRDFRTNDAGALFRCIGSGADTRLVVPHPDDWARYVIALLEENLRDPEMTRFRCGLKVGWPEHLAAFTFALVVLLCDDYLLLLRESLIESQAVIFADLAPSKIERFLIMMRRLPMELQKVVANRMQGLTRDHVPFREREIAFLYMFRLH